MTIRDNGIDSIKGIAIILVVLGHVITNGVSSQLFHDEFITNLCNTIYFFHMPLFFFISGYLTKAHDKTEGKKNRKKYCKKIIALLIPYIVFSLIYLCLKVIFSKTGAVVNTVSTSEMFYLLIKPVGEYWFLYALMVFKLLYYHISKNKLLYMWGGLIAVLLYFYRFDILEYTEGLRRSLPFFIYFYLGNCFNLIEDKCNEHINSMIKKLSLIALFITILTVYNECVWNEAASLKIIYINFIIVMFMLSRSLFPNKILNDIGKNTMCIYLLHPFFIVACKVILSKISYVDEITYLILTSVISTYLPYIIYMKIIRKYKITDILISTNKCL